ncbi:hypothetical protein OG613_49285 (plasmid) [Streptomyces sp. NBC_00015]|uniref:hypothetical protein n=1 Tax=Streptomyces sp. NBC_00015 TaxID=2903611 RepID=UPI002F9131E7
MSRPVPSELTPHVITPVEAQRRLLLTQEAGCRPDPVDVDHARRLARDMACGDWDDANPVPLVLCSHGAVIRGVHRLHAVVISQVPRAFLIARDVPHHVRHVPGSKARTAADAIGAIGVVSHRKETAAAVQLVHLYDTERDTLPWTAWEHRVFTNAETVRLLRTRYPDLPRSVPAMTALRSGLRSTPPAALAAAYLITRASSASPAAADFFQGLIFTPRLEPGDPRGDLHAWFSAQSAAPRGKLASAHQLGLILTCWNAWAAGTVWDGSVFGAATPMPALRRVAAALAPAAQRPV